MKKPWFKKVADRCRKKGKSRIILDRESKDPYLERFYIHPRWLTLGLFRIVIHRFWKSDDDGGLHDHPWPFITTILEGNYYEHTPKGKFLRSPGEWRWASANALHRVELLKEGQEVWTLFIMGPKIREWGFVPTGTRRWIKWDKYIAQKLRNQKVKHESENYYI